MAEFTVMKGFLDGFSVKGGESPETLPPDPGKDVTDEAEVDEVADHPEGAKGGTSTTTDDLTMEKDVSTVEGGAKRDVKDGYTEDIQEEKINDEASKGFDVYNRMVSKGFAVETEHLNKWNIGEMVDSIAQNASQMVAKEMDDSLTVKKTFGSRAMSGLESMTGAMKKGRKQPGKVRRAYESVRDTASKYAQDVKDKVGGSAVGRGEKRVAQFVGDAVNKAQRKMGKRGAIASSRTKAERRDLGRKVLGGAVGTGVIAGTYADTGKKKEMSDPLVEKGVATTGKKYWNRAAQYVGDVANRAQRRMGQRGAIAASRSTKERRQLGKNLIKGTAGAGTAFAGGAALKSSVDKRKDN